MAATNWPPCRTILGNRQMPRRNRVDIRTVYMIELMEYKKPKERSPPLQHSCATCAAYHVVFRPRCDIGQFRPTKKAICKYWRHRDVTRRANDLLPSTREQ